MIHLLYLSPLLCLSQGTGQQPLGLPSGGDFPGSATTLATVSVRLHGTCLAEVDFAFICSTYDRNAAHQVMTLFDICWRLPSYRVFCTYTRETARRLVPRTALEALLVLYSAREWPSGGATPHRMICISAIDCFWAPTRSCMCPTFPLCQRLSKGDGREQLGHPARGNIPGCPIPRMAVSTYSAARPVRSGDWRFL